MLLDEQVATREIQLVRHTVEPDGVVVLEVCPDEHSTGRIAAAPGGPHYRPLMTLHLVGSDIVHMDKGTFMWVQLTHFAIDAPQDDRSLLASLIASPGYAHDYATPFDADAVVTEPAIHGRWWRSSIRAQSFTPGTATDAESLLQAWADNQEWTDPDFHQSPEAQRRLQDLYVLLRSGAVYRLENPGVEDEHEYGFVTGGMGFHEFVVIDRRSHRLHVLVASDD